MMQGTSSVIVTASSHGLGLSIAKRFSESYNIILHGRNPGRLLEAATHIDNVVESILGDLRDEDTLLKLYTAGVKHNSSVLINNAAIPCYGTKLEEMTSDQIHESLSTNLISPILLSHKLYPVIKSNSPGGIININSIVGVEPKEKRSVHSATKWGLRGFSKSLNIEALKDNVRIVNVYPTRIMTIEEFTYGLDPSDVSDRIYNNFHDTNILSDMVIDGRPLEYRSEKKYEA
tara:strand:- start:1095 stop:1790 length:696 start_codon:yes stop_codon:yes gene_type:complete